MTRVAALLAALCILSTAAAAQVAPYHTWRTLETAHFHVHVRAGLEREGRVAGAAAERAYAQLSTELVPPRGTIDLVVSDDADYSNGSAAAFPGNRIIIYATPPIETQSLRFNEDWLKLVITHELTHIFHLDRTRGLWSVAQHIFGRGPDLFPDTYGPSWFTEGLAVYYESRFTEGGRLKDSEHELLAQTSALEHHLPDLNDLSLASPLFPGGERAYGYGSLLVDYLARTRGDTTIRRFVEEQSAQLIPWRLDHDAKEAFGITFTDAFKQWSDSVQLSVGTPRPPMTGWRELTAHGYYATDPRWLNDNTLVYASSDGRSSTREMQLTLDGGRRDLGRRNSLGPSVKLPDGGLLFAQVDFTTPYEVRSDLFIQRDGKQRAITHGMRLVQPDVSRDGRIVAVQIGATRSSLVLVDTVGRLVRVLRNAGADETWSEPRFSPDGRLVAAAHRVHGGFYTIEVLNASSVEASASGIEARRLSAQGSVSSGETSVLVIDGGRFLISTPSWAPDGASILYTSEQSGTPALVRRAVVNSAQIATAVPSPPVSPSSNIVTPELSPDGRTLAAGTLRWDGYHIGIAPATSTSLTVGAIAQLPDSASSEPLAPGDFHSYHAWRSLMPRYWYPIVEASPDRGTRIGAKTSGYDVLGRHAYSAYVTVPTTGSFPTAGFAYEYAGFRRPIVDFAVFQDYTSDGSLTNGGTTTVVGTLLRQTRDASIAATFVRPRVRTYSAFSLGVGAEHRSFLTDPSEFLKQLDPSLSHSFTYPRAFVSAQWSNTQRPTLSISPEDGIAIAATARERIRTDSVHATASASIVGTTSMYKSLDFPGFAHHVLALRLAGGAEDNHAPTGLEIGGVSGNTVQIVSGYTVGEGRRTFGVRGFPAASIVGTQALGGTLEYRIPALLGGTGVGALPFFFDRASVSAFADAANASCNGATRYTVCSPAPFIGRTIASAGAELVLSASFFDWDTAQLVRTGFAVPVVGRDLARASAVSAYLAYGFSF